MVVYSRNRVFYVSGQVGRGTPCVVSGTSICGRREERECWPLQTQERRSETTPVVVGTLPKRNSVLIYLHKCMALTCNVLKECSMCVCVCVCVCVPAYTHIDTCSSIFQINFYTSNNKGIRILKAL